MNDEFVVLAISNLASSMFKLYHILFWNAKPFADYDQDPRGFLIIIIEEETILTLRLWLRHTRFMEVVKQRKPHDIKWM